MVLYFVIHVAVSFVPCIGPILQLVVLPPLQAGMTIVSLRQLKGRGWTFGDFFSGFQWAGSIIANQLLIGLVALPCLIPLFAAAVIADQPGRGAGKDEAVLVALGLGLVGLLALCYFGLRISFFALPLIIDRSCGPVEAIRGSWVLTRGHFWPLFGVAMLLGLINLGGALPLLVGLLATVPLTSLVSNAGYLLIAGTRPPLPGPRSPVDY
jgi:hypothetical protein